MTYWTLSTCETRYTESDGSKPYGGDENVKIIMNASIDTEVRMDVVVSMLKNKTLGNCYIYNIMCVIIEIWLCLVTGLGGGYMIDNQ